MMSTDNTDTDTDTNDTGESPPQPTHDTGGVGVGMVDFEARIHNHLHRQRNKDKNSHVELDPSVFHISSLGYPIRQIYLSKLGLKHHDEATLATFKMGSLIHEFMEEVLDDSRLITEMDVEGIAGDVKLVGRCDAYDPREDVVYDFKSRGGWYKFDPPTQRHIDQLLGYMWCTGADYGQVVYINKKNLEVRTWPEDGPFEFDRDRWGELMPKIHRVRQVILDRGIATREEDIPFEKGSDWISQQEQLQPWMVR